MRLIKKTTGRRTTRVHTVRTNYGAMCISLGEMLTFRRRLRWGKNVVAPPATAGLLVQMDLGWLECMSPCARVGSGRQTQANYAYDEQMNDGYIGGE